MEKKKKMSAKKVERLKKRGAKKTARREKRNVSKGKRYVKAAERKASKARKTKSYGKQQALRETATNMRQEGQKAIKTGGKTKPASRKNTRVTQRSAHRDTMAQMPKSDRRSYGYSRGRRRR